MACNGYDGFITSRREHTCRIEGNSILSSWAGSGRGGQASSGRLSQMISRGDGSNNGAWTARADMVGGGSGDGVGEAVDASATMPVLDGTEGRVLGEKVSRRRRRAGGSRPAIYHQDARGGWGNSMHGSSARHHGRPPDGDGAAASTYRMGRLLRSATGTQRWD